MKSKARRAIDGTVQFSKFYGNKHKPRKPLTEIPLVCGLDIEGDSHSGDPYLMCAVWVDDKGETYKDHTTAFNHEEILTWLTRDKLLDSVNGFWNISYDGDGILKHFPKQWLFLLSMNSRLFITQDFKLTTEHAGNCYFKILYIKGKTLIITKGKKVYKFFDFQLLYNKQSLQTTAQSLLKESKQDFDRTQSSKHQFLNDNVYRQLAIAYCYQDARLTAKLGRIGLVNINKFVPTRNLLSTANIAAQYMKHVGFYTPRRFRTIHQDFLKCFRGGRFEAPKKGYCQDFYNYDIKSAYVDGLTTLKCLTDDFHHQHTRDEYSKNALYGAYQIDLDIPKDDYLGIIGLLNKHDVMHYPVGDLKKIHVDKVILDYLNKEGYDYRVLWGREIFDSNAKCLLKDPGEFLYKVKENKKDYDYGYRQAAKIIVLSMYGKTMELVDDTVGEILSIDEITDPTTILRATEEGVLTTKHTGIFKAGMFYMPAYGSYITSRTQIQLFEAAKRTGDENLIALHTDGVMTFSPNLPTGTWLGDWARKGPYNLKLGKCGYYEITDNDGNLIERKARSYGNIPAINLEQIPVTRRFSLKQVVRNDQFEQINIISEKLIKSDINSDEKRIWPTKLKYTDLQAGGRLIDSTPHLVTG